MKCSSEHVYCLRSNKSPSGPSLPVGTFGIGRFLPISAILFLYLFRCLFSFWLLAYIWVSNSRTHGKLLYLWTETLVKQCLDHPFSLYKCRWIGHYLYSSVLYPSCNFLTPLSWWLRGSKWYPLCGKYNFFEFLNFPITTTTMKTIHITQCPLMRFWGAKIVPCSCTHLGPVQVMEVIIIDI